MLYVVAILGLAVLMVVHESGHYFAARAFGMRVTRFSIGFGPPFFKILPQDGFWWFSTAGNRIKFKLFKHNPEKQGETVFQVAVIPFLAYVQIAGMNPLEDVEPDDKGSYANASIWARIVTIVAGPVANYVMASVFFFLPLYFGEMLVPSSDPTQIDVKPGMAAAEAGFKDADRIVEIEGGKVTQWGDISEKIYGNAGKEITVKIERDGEPFELKVIPRKDETGESERGLIGVTPHFVPSSFTFGEAAKIAIRAPWMAVKTQIEGFEQIIRGKGEAKLGGPKAMVDQMKKEAEQGWAQFVSFLGFLSAILALFNMLPLPALDGGRLLFLSYEATTRKRANPMVEAHIHAIGLLMLLGLMVYVTIAHDFHFGDR